MPATEAGFGCILNHKAFDVLATIKQITPEQWSSSLVVHCYLPGSLKKMRMPGSTLRDVDLIGLEYGLGVGTFKCASRAESYWSSVLLLKLQCIYG